MKLAKPITTTLGAVALTLVAAGSALAVNIGILSQNGNSAVGALDTLATTTTATVSQPSPQFIYVDLSDPTATVASQPTQPQVATTPASTVVDNGAHEYEGAEYDD